MSTDMKPIQPHTIVELAQHIEGIQRELKSYEKQLQMLTENVAVKREIFDQSTGEKLQNTLPVMQNAFFEVWSEGFDTGLIQGQKEQDESGVITYTENGKRYFISHMHEQPNLAHAKHIRKSEAFQIISESAMTNRKAVWLPMKTAVILFKPEQQQA